MTRRRLVICGVIVAAAVGLLVTPYLIPERVGAWRGGYYSLAQCTRFMVAPDSVIPGGQSRPAQPDWTASITISNVGPRHAELVSAEIISKFRTGSESWPVTVPGIVLRPGAVISFEVPLPATGRESDGPRVWELNGRYRTRESKATEWIMALHNRLPRDMQLDSLIYRPGEYQGSLLAHCPENYHSMLTNEMGWQSKAVGLNPGVRGLHREWGSRVEVEQAFPDWRSRVFLLRKHALGKPVIVTTTIPAILVEIGNEPPPGMMTTKGELTFYRGQLDQITDDGIRLRASTNSTEDFKSMGIRAADILAIRMVSRDAEWEQREEMERILGQQDGAANGRQRVRSETNLTSRAAGTRR